MVEIKTGWTEESLREYYKFTILSGKKSTKLLLIAVPLLYLTVTAICLIIYFSTKFPYILLILLMLTVFTVVAGLIFAFMIKDIIKSTLRDSANSDFNIAFVGDDSIIFFKDEKPLGELSWDKITKIIVNDKAEAAYISTEDNSTLILDSKRIINGTWENLKKTVEAKNDKLSKKA